VLDGLYPQLYPDHHHSTKAGIIRLAEYLLFVVPPLLLDLLFVVEQYFFTSFYNRDECFSLLEPLWRTIRGDEVLLEPFPMSLFEVRISCVFGVKAQG